MVTHWCFYCDRPLKSHHLGVGSIIDKLLPSKQNVIDWPMKTEDHRTPRAMTRGQVNNEVVIACRDCNAKKGSLTLEEYRVLHAFRYGYISGVTWKFPGEEK